MGPAKPKCFRFSKVETDHRDASVAPTRAMLRGWNNSLSRSGKMNRSCFTGTPLAAFPSSLQANVSPWIRGTYRDNCTLPMVKDRSLRSRRWTLLMLVTNETEQYYGYSDCNCLDMEELGRTHL